ncbi:MAG: sigma-70 family RNA polymerase sigma factor [Phycisphaerales bacterium]|nr:sigma-70 family RNA polymerase sigma factor [Phycisphaerales bacterium]
MSEASPQNSDSEIAANRGLNSASTLLPLIYRELRQLAARRIAREPAGQTLQATALVHEAYLKLLESGARWEGRAHFFAAAAQAMRCILVDRARARSSQKRGGGWKRSADDPEQVADLFKSNDDELLALDAALDRLERRDARKAQIVMLRYFAGLSIEEVAESLELSRTTVKDEWAFARAWLHAELDHHD